MSDTFLPQDSEAEVLLTRAEWADTRKKYLGLVGNRRDDAALPYPVPPGGAWARKVTSVSAIDTARVGSSVVRFRLSYDAPHEDLSVPLGAASVTTDASAAGAGSRALWPRPADDTVSSSVTINQNLSMSRQPDPNLWIGRYVASGLRVPLVFPSALPTYGSAWWSESAWGRALTVVFVPPVSFLGSWAPVTSQIVPFGTKSDLVLVKKAHPYLPAAALERARGGPDVTWFALTRVPVRSRALVMYFSDDDNRAERITEGWTSIYRHHQESGNVFARAGRSVQGVIDQVRTIASQAGKNLVAAVTRGDIQALQSLAAAAVATAVAGPAGLSLVGSTDPWRDAARLGALHYALWISPITEATRGGNIISAGWLMEPYQGSYSASEALAGRAVAAGMIDISLPTHQAFGMAVTDDDLAAAEVIAQRLMIVNPDEANRILQKIALEGGYVDLVFARLTIEAEKNGKKREALKAEISAKQVEFNEKYLKYITAIVGLLPGVGTALTIASILYQLAVAAQSMEVALTAARHAELAADRELRALEAEIAALEAEIAALGLDVPPAPKVGAPSPSATTVVGGKLRPWWSWMTTEREPAK